MGRLLVVLGVWAWSFAFATMSGIHSLAVLGGAFAVAVAAWIVWVAFERARPAPAAR